MKDCFVSRHIGANENQTQEMLQTIGVSSVEELIDQVIPKNIQLPTPLDLPAGISEYEFASQIRAMGRRNTPLRTFIGMGYYGTATPAAIMRNIFENPAWYTSYTPYQAEISQGRLEALLNFQTMVCSMTAMEISNCSLLDEATAAAEAAAMMFALRSRAAVKEGRNLLLVDENIFPQTLDLLLTRCEPQGIDIAVDSFYDYEFTGREFGAIVQYPAANGEICDYTNFTTKCHDKEIMVSAAVDILALAMLKAPGEWGADIAIGSTQRFGIPMGFGGPHAGYLATKESFKRSMPGRIIGVSVDRLGNRALRLALQTREQHIKRDKATSNICTAQALLATMAGMYAVYHGADGIRSIAENCHAAATTTAIALEKLGYNLLTENYFDTLEVEVLDASIIRDLAEIQGFNFFFPDETTVRLSFDEITDLEEVNRVIRVFAIAIGGDSFPRVDNLNQEISFDPDLTRQSEILTQEVFKKYHSETELMRYIKMLERRDISLADSMISLGSCTMKLNSAVSMMPLSLTEWGGVHPFVPTRQVAGYMQLIDELDHDLSIITGFSKMSFQPNSGANGEYAGLMVIRAYHASRGQSHRNIALIPASAHGTNFASAAMAGLKVVVTACDENGNIDIKDWKTKAEENRDNLACCMITYPSTHGIFESEIRELVKITHDAGGQVYYDGANMNAVVGLSSPGFIGADVCHLNLHKTFAIPHGGGGPGVGAIGAAEHLAKFLPSHPLVKCGGNEGITAVAAAPFGSASVLLITYAYIKMMGGEGLKRASQMAIVAANYMACKLRGEIEIVYSGQTGRVGHEMILDYRQYRAEYGVECGDIARRLMDYGFHAPTLSFPVHDTLMVEPTESENKEELDRFMEALVAIKGECRANIGLEDHLVKNAPHTALEIASDTWAHPYTRHQAAYPLAWIGENKFFPYVSKIDNGYGDRNLVCCAGSC
ncbi:MAG: aminomethyl-transferring glycine dehydrogenase [Mucinivorans sp.]